MYKKGEFLKIINESSVSTKYGRTGQIVEVLEDCGYSKYGPVRVKILSPRGRKQEEIDPVKGVGVLIKRVERL